MNSLPFPGSLSTQISPPIMLTNRLEIVKPETCPSVFSRGGSVCLAKGLKEFPLLLFGQADSGVSNRKLERDRLRLFFHQPGGNDDLTLFREFHSVVAQVDQDLPQPERVAHQRKGHVL